MNVIPKSEYVSVDRVLGVTYGQIEATHTQAEVDQFRQWHAGQTGVVSHEGELVVFAWDYERWVGQRLACAVDPDQHSGHSE